MPAGTIVSVSHSSRSIDGVCTAEAWECPAPHHSSARRTLSLSPGLQCVAQLLHLLGRARREFQTIVELAVTPLRSSPGAGDARQSSGKYRRQATPPPKSAPAPPATTQSSLVGSASGESAPASHGVTGAARKAHEPEACGQEDRSSQRSTSARWNERNRWRSGAAPPVGNVHSSGGGLSRRRQESLT